MCVKQHTEWDIPLLIAMYTIRLPKISSYIKQKSFSRMLGDRRSRIIRNVPLPNTTVSKVIEEARCNRGCHFFKRFRSSNGFTLLDDEFTDGADLSVLLASVRHKVYQWKESAYVQIFISVATSVFGEIRVSIWKCQSRRYYHMLSEHWAATLCTRQSQVIN
jgi:hypothetical protein